MSTSTIIHLCVVSWPCVRCITHCTKKSWIEIKLHLKIRKISNNVGSSPSLLDNIVPSLIRDIYLICYAHILTIKSCFCFCDLKENIMIQSFETLWNPCRKKMHTTVTLTVKKRWLCYDYSNLKYSHQSIRFWRVLLKQFLLKGSELDFTERYGILIHTYTYTL